MKKLQLLILFSVISLGAFAQLGTDTIKKNDLTLIFTNTDAGFSKATRQRLIDAFFIVYPKEMTEYNPDASKVVTFMIDTGYKGVAATSRNVVHYNPTWFVSHPEDIDVVTHEVMHIVQNYGRNRGTGAQRPGWLTEGIADFVRNEYGINNEKAGWKFADFKATQSYTNAYKVTARFLYWAQKNKDPQLVKQLDAAMRNGTYTPEMWQQLTGKNVDDLWAEYAANPVIY